MFIHSRALYRPLDERTGLLLCCSRLSSGRRSFGILGLQPRDKAAMLGVKTKEYFLEEFT